MDGWMCAMQIHCIDLIAFLSIYSNTIIWGQNVQVGWIYLHVSCFIIIVLSGDFNAIMEGHSE